MAARPRTLVLVPTVLEEELLVALGGFPSARARFARCGFGVVSAAARAAQLLAEERPARVLLVGIAGSFDRSAAPLASATCFGRVRLDGLGVGSEPVPPSRLGFPLWDGDPGAPVFESLPLAGAEPGELLTVCSASATAAEAERRRERFPEALGEDMEAFGVALACHLARVPLCVVRGFSNAVGERARAHWRLCEALGAAHRRALEELAREAWGP